MNSKNFKNLRPSRKMLNIKHWSEKSNEESILKYHLNDQKCNNLSKTIASIDKCIFLPFHSIEKLRNNLNA